MDTAQGGGRSETIVIGGGQAGLAVAYHLRRRGRPVMILDANPRIGDAWRNRWDTLRVFTPARYDGLPGWPFPAQRWSYPTKDEVADYLEAYAARFQLDVRSEVAVDRLTREDGRYVVRAANRCFEADNVVVATGGYQTPAIPAFAADLDPQIRQLHSSEYRNPSQLGEGAVLVVGAGNSGAEIAVEAAAEHATWLAGRDTGQEPARPGSFADRLFTPPFVFALHHLFIADRALGRKVQRELTGKGLPLARVRRKDLQAAGVERVPRVTAAADGRPVLEDGQTLEVATVVWGTGYTTDFSWIDLPVFDDDGQPRHDRGVVDDEPGLYFIGLFFLYAASSSLILGVGRDADHIAGHIASHRVRNGEAHRRRAGTARANRQR